MTIRQMFMIYDLCRRDMLASVATVARYESATCDEGRFISPEECALAPLDLSSRGVATCRFTAEAQQRSC